MATIDVTLTGPVFDGRAAVASTALLGDIVAEVTAEGYALVMGHLNRSIRHPTPYYETQVTTDRPGAAEARVHDRGVVYGPWLEGVSSRNQTTRFKGYHSFRLATQDLERRVPDLAGAAVRRHLAAMGG